MCDKLIPCSVFFAVICSAADAQEYSTVASPGGVSDFTYSYINEQGSFMLVKEKGVGTYFFDDKSWYSNLVFEKAATLNPGGDSGFIYKDKDDPFFLFFSRIPRDVPGFVGKRFFLYYSLNGTNFVRWNTPSGTRRHSVADSAAELVGGGSDGSGDSFDPSRFPITKGWIEDSDGSTKAKIKAKLSARANDGLVEVTVYVRKSGVNGTGYASGYASLMDANGNTLFQTPSPVNKQEGADASGSVDGEEMKSFSVPLDVLAITTSIGLAVNAEDSSGFYDSLEDFTEDIRRLTEAVKAGRELAEEGIRVYAIASGAGG